MATERPQVTVFNSLNPSEAAGTATVPAVLFSPIRPDLVRYVHTNVAKNFQQPHGVFEHAGYETSAESWGTGRAVARIPRVAGGGTHRAGQAAFGNMCRGGGMFAPKKTWRRWNRKVNLTERRHALASAIAASALPSLVAARGHRVEEIREFPVVVSDEVQNFIRTQAAKDFLYKLGCKEELDKVENSWTIRKGQGKARNRRHTYRRGPLLVFDTSNGCHRAFRALLGVECISVDKLSLLKLAPGGTLGRLVIWTESALKKLHTTFAETRASSESLKSYCLPKSVMTNPDLARIINSLEVQSVLNPAKTSPLRIPRTPFNPLKNKRQMKRLNPAVAQIAKKRCTKA